MNLKINEFMPAGVLSVEVISDLCVSICKNVTLSPLEASFKTVYKDKHMEPLGLLISLAAGYVTFFLTLGSGLQSTFNPDCCTC